MPVGSATAAPKPPSPPSRSASPSVRPSALAHQLHRALAGLDVDAGLGVCAARSGVIATAGDRLVLEHELVRGDVVRHGHRVAAVEAGEAEALARQVDRVQHAADRQVGQRVGADELARMPVDVMRERR